MKIEYHNAHGSQLLVSLTPMEALTLARKLVDTASCAIDTKVNHYISLPCQFEDDNDRWEPTDLDIVAETGNPADFHLARFPCRTDTWSDMNSAPEFCTIQEGHKGFCYPR